MNHTNSSDIRHSWFEALQKWPKQQPHIFLVVAVCVWFALYKSLIPLAEMIVAWLPVDRASHLGGALQFFFYDTPKVLLLLTGIVFVMGMVNSWFTPERTRALLAGRSEGVANVMAASLGIVTPFCSCSAVPLFIGFVQAGVPLGATFSFLEYVWLAGCLAVFRLRFGRGYCLRLDNWSVKDGDVFRRLGTQYAAC